MPGMLNPNQFGHDGAFAPDVRYADALDHLAASDFTPKTENPRELMIADAPTTPQGNKGLLRESYDYRTLKKVPPRLYPTEGKPAPGPRDVLSRWVHPN